MDLLGLVTTWGNDGMELFAASRAARPSSSYGIGAPKNSGGGGSGGGALGSSMRSRVLSCEGGSTIGGNMIPGAPTRGPPAPPQQYVAAFPLPNSGVPQSLRPLVLRARSTSPLGAGDHGYGDRGDASGAVVLVSSPRERQRRSGGGGTVPVVDAVAAALQRAKQARVAAVAATYYLSSAAGKGLGRFGRAARTPGRSTGTRRSTAAKYSSDIGDNATQRSVSVACPVTGDNEIDSRHAGNIAMQQLGSAANQSLGDEDDGGDKGQFVGGGSGVGGELQSRVPFPGAKPPIHVWVPSGGMAKIRPAATRSCHSLCIVDVREPVPLTEAVAGHQRSHLHTAPVPVKSIPGPGARAPGSHLARPGLLSDDAAHHGIGAGAAAAADRLAMESAHFGVTGTMNTDGRFRGYAQVDVSFQQERLPLVDHRSSRGCVGVERSGGDDEFSSAGGAHAVPGWGWGGGFLSSVPAPPRTRSVLPGGGSGTHGSGACGGSEAAEGASSASHSFVISSLEIHSPSGKGGASLPPADAAIPWGTPIAARSVGPTRGSGSLGVSLPSLHTAADAAKC